MEKKFVESIANVHNNLHRHGIGLESLKNFEIKCLKCYCL